MMSDRFSKNGTGNTRGTGTREQEREQGYPLVVIIYAAKYSFSMQFQRKLNDLVSDLD